MNADQPHRMALIGICALFAFAKAIFRDFSLVIDA